MKREPTVTYRDSLREGSAKIEPANRQLRKELGQYYTPQEATRILCNWAIRDSKERILEPSFGACGFLEAAKSKLKQLGAVRPLNQLYGCDIDGLAFEQYLSKKFRVTSNGSRFLHRDFLSVRPGDFNNLDFDVIIGNPPYVSYHNMNEEVRRTVEEMMASNGFRPIPKASLWAYFVLHGASFLKAGGRMAWILPSSFLFAEYAAVVRKRINRLFKRCLVVQLQERLFLSEGTEELTVVLLAEGRSDQEGDQGEMHVDFAATLGALELCIEAWSMGGGSGARPLSDRLGATFISSEAHKCMLEIEKFEQVARLDELIDVRIGIVTGANPFFVINDSEAKDRGLYGDSLKLILAKFLMAPGIAITVGDLQRAREKDKRCLLINTTSPSFQIKNSPLRRYLATMPRALRRSVGTFKKRPLWHQPDDGRIPDGFFPYMYHHGPRLIINTAQCTSTNTIHRVYFRKPAVPPGVPLDTWKKICAISVLSTYSQLMGELEGRCYGAGVLKHEPSEVGKIRIIIPSNCNLGQIDSVISEVDEALRAGRDEDARQIANAFVLSAFDEGGRSWIVKILERALSDARNRRRRSRSS